MIPQSGYCQRLCPQGELQLPPIFPGSFPIAVGGTDPGFFWITTSVLTSGVYELLCSPFKSGLYFKQPCGSPESKPHWPSASGILVTPLPGVEPSGWGAWCGWDSDPVFLGVSLCNCNCLLICELPTLGLWSLARPCLCPSYPLIVVPSLYL